MEKKRILIVDEEEDFVKMLRARLQIEGYEVLIAEDGTKGLQIARKERPDLIILDIMMPGMDGHAVCDMLKKSSLTWSIPIIYLTAKSSPADEVLALEKGAKYFLTKPYNPPMLLEMVKSAIMDTNQVPKKQDRILVIDKDLGFADEAGARLKQAGFEVVSALTAEQGLREAREHSPDIILLDFLTSHEDSHASVKIISSDEILQNIPLFVLAPEAIMAKADKNLPNLEKFITKPVNYILLLETLRRTLETRKA
jgi:DNA-binding response OmpR family regulator